MKTMYLNSFDIERRLNMKEKQTKNSDLKFECVKIYRINYVGMYNARQKYIIRTMNCYTECQIVKSERGLCK